MQDTHTEKTRQPLSLSIETAAAVVAERCFKNKEFGEKFLADPHAALTAQKIQTGKRRVHAHENDARNWHIVLPDLKAREAIGKFSEKELKAMKDSDMRRLSGGEVAVALAVLGTLGATAAVATTVVGTGATVGAHYSSKKK